MPKKTTRLDLRQKSDYVTAKINEGSMDNKSYTYLYDIVKYLVNRKIKGKPLEKACFDEDVVQNVVYNIYNVVILEQRYNEIQSIFAFCNEAVKLELLKTTRNKYMGRTELLEDNPSEEEDNFTYDDSYLNTETLTEIELIINMEGSLFNIIKLIYSRLKQSNLEYKNKHLLTFVILLCHIREDNSLLKKMPNKVKVVAKEIMQALDHSRKFI